MLLQQTPVPPRTQAPSAAEIREQVRQQIEAAREQAQAAREQAQAARDAARAAAEENAAPEAPPALPRAQTSVQVSPFVPMIPPQAVDISIAFFMMIAVIIVGLPLARAWARRLDRKPVPPALDPGVTSQLQRIETAVEAMAIEVERISEAQRYMAKLETEREGRDTPSLRAGGQG